MKNTQPVTLPQYPKDTEYEEFIAAYFQASQYYVERSIIDRRKKNGKEGEVLEIDIVATDYGCYPPEQILIEIKSGSWGFPEVFKLVGWMQYLEEINRGLFVVQKKANNHPLKSSIAGQLNVEIISNTELERTEESLARFIDPKHVDALDIQTWRYAYWIERKMLRYLKARKKSEKKEAFFNAEEYYHEVSNSIFFTKNRLERIQKLYALKGRFPNLSAQCGNEETLHKTNGNRIPEKVFKDTFWYGKINTVQAACFIEHLSRITIIKNSIDLLLYEDDRAQTDVEVIPGWSIDQMESMPESFRLALREIEGDEDLALYPTFWQWFIYVFGGFILDGEKDREYALLSAKTGIAESHINRALEVYDLFFPTEGGWLKSRSNANYRYLNLFPAPLHGIGAFYRSLHYSSGTEKDYEALDRLFDEMTNSHLANWINAAYNLLNKC